jgi:predicted HicB family RNase H-like nuclease
MNKPHRNIGLRINPQLYRKVRYYCLNNDLSLQEYIIKLIEKDLLVFEVEKCING